MPSVTHFNMTSLFLSNFVCTMILSLDTTFTTYLLE